MGLNKAKGKISTFLKKNKYVVLILIIGLVFMLIPKHTDQKSSKTEQKQIGTPITAPTAIEEKLANILSAIEGAGDVKVLLTQAEGEETIYQTDSDTSANNESHTTQVETVVLSNADRSQSGMIRQINPPTYLGAIIICEGANNASIRLAVVDAVSKVTGLGADRICVLKMK